jgi:hypothetical protein
MASLERLEDRTLLSNVVAEIMKAPSGELTLGIQADVFSDTFTVTENPNGTVTVTGSAEPLSNGNHLAYTTSQAITNIYINLPSSAHGGNSDNVTITGTGTGTQNIWVVAPGFSASSPGANITLNVTGLHSSGFLNVYDGPTTGTGPNAISPAFSPPGFTFPVDGKGNRLNYLGGRLTATVTGSQFASLLIEQSGDFPANVTLEDDTIPGNVQVYEGVSGGGKNGNGANLITVDEVDFGPTSLFQFYGPQLGGAGDGTGDTVYGRPSNSLRKGPPSIQTYQGDGAHETVVVESSTFYGNLYVSQGDGKGDRVHIANVVIGALIPVVPGVLAKYYGGTLWISQGDGGGDLVVVDSNGSEPGAKATGNVFNKVYIFQGDGGGPKGGTCAGFPGNDDVVVFDEATVYSDLVILQNAKRVYDAAAVPSVAPRFLVAGDGNGFNLVQIGVDTTTPFGHATGSVSVGEGTFVFQGGENNETDLGGTDDLSGIDFETAYLDIFTGKYGGGTVMAANTTVDVGSFFGLDFVIDGGGFGNVYIDLGGNNPSPLPFSSNYSS